MTFYDDVIYAHKKVKRRSLVFSCKYDIAKRPVRRLFFSYRHKNLTIVMKSVGQIIIWTLFKRTEKKHPQPSAPF